MSRDIPADVRDIFNRFDYNKSGRMDYRELRNCLNALGVDVSQQGASNVLLQYDRDGNGLLDVEEFAGIVKRLREYYTGQSYGGVEHRQVRGNISVEVRAVFEKFDDNRSGKLDYTELRAALRSMGLDVDSHQAAEVIKRFDTDGNGLMEVDEFNTLVFKLRESLYPQHVHGLRVALYILNTPGRVSASDRRSNFGAPAHHGPAASAEYEKQAGSARSYILEHQLEMALSSAISQAVHERAADGKSRIAELITGSRHSAVAGVGSASSSQRLQDAEARAASLKADVSRLKAEHERELRNLREAHQVEIAKTQRRLVESEGDFRRESDEIKRERKEATRLREEVSALQAKLRQSRAYENMVNKAVERQVREGFMSCDKDGSGDIDAKELKKALSQIGLKGDTSQAQSVIAKFDKAGKGSLNLVDFSNLVKELQSMQSMGMLGAPAPAPAAGGLGGYYRR